MASPQVLALLEFSAPFELECDVSGVGIGAVLLQKRKPITFASQPLGPINQSLSTYEKELIAIIFSMKKWQRYLQGRHFVIKIDHHSLRYFLNHRANTYFQQKWVSKLIGYDYEIKYKHGRDIVVDAFSKEFEPYSQAKGTCSQVEMTECLAITYPYFGWLDELRREVEQNKWIT